MSDIVIGNGSGTDNVSLGADSSLTVGNGSDTVNVSASTQDTITIGNGSDKVTVTGATDSTVTAGNGNDTVTLNGGSDNTVTIGNGNVTLVASSQNNDTITTGNGNDTVYMGANDTVTTGKGSELLILPNGTAALAVPSSVTVLEDHSIGLDFSASLAATAIGQDTIYGFAAADQLQFTTSQVANFTALKADATQVGQNTVITLDSSDSVTLENVKLSSLQSKNFTFVGGAGGSSSIVVTITGVPSDATLSSAADPSGVSFNSATNTWTVAAAALNDLALNAGEVTNAILNVTATDTSTGSSVSQTVALTVNPIAPTLNAPTTLTVNEDGTVALGISETPFDPRDTISLTITGVPADATLSAGTKNSNGSWTLTPAQLTGLTIRAGEVTAATLTVTATNTEGATASTSKTISLTVNPVAPTLTAPSALTVNADGSVALSISETPFDPRDTVSVTITGVPSDATLSAGTKNSNGSWTLTPAQLNGLTLGAGQATVTTLTVTATNTQGVTASTSDSIALTINPVLTLGVSVVGGGQVQQGQTLVATATIIGDNADAGATINYQWQSSSNGGATWTNVGGAAAGSFANGQPSSFLQLTESNEGQEFRAVASFTGSANNVITTTSSATAAVADVTPEITIPFTYTVDDLSITKTVNGTPTQIYNDTFSQAPIASPTILSNGVATPIVFITQGSTWTESGGQAVASSTGVAVNPNISGGNSAFDLALLNTNTDPTSTLGLKESTAFTVSSTFDLTTPPTGGYGMELTDGTSTQPVDELERLIVQRMNGSATVELIQANLTTNTQTVVASHTLTAAELANNTQIEFQMSHAANSTAVTGTFELIDNGTVTSTTAFVPTASIFTNGIDWTRVDVGAFTNAGVGLNVGAGQSPREGQTLTASATTNDSDASINYQWQESSNGTLWTNIGTDSPTYVVQEADEGLTIRVVASTTDPDNSQTTSVTSVVTGPVLDALPTVTTPIITGAPQEGQTLTASASSGQSDNPVSYAWFSSANGYTTAIGAGATYLVQEGDESATIEVVATATNDNGATISATSAATSAVLDAAPTVTTPTITGTAQEGQTLTASASAGQSDNPVSYAWYSSADNFTNPIGTGATYLVQEGDENNTIEAMATATNDNGVTITATSTATSAVLDAAPTVTTPTITGIAQEGQTLTASATSGQSDNPVSYTWYSSADNYTNPIGTGATYVVKEGDENNTIEAKATATNDNGVTISATSAPTAGVIDNASLSLTVTDISGGTPAQGQIMVASATINGDADDSTAPVTYQWQSSSNGGTTWTNVAATTFGQFNGALSSFYQFGEQDEGNIFRAVASFTDDTGQVVTATSAPTAPVADIAPIVTQPFSFALDEFKVVKGANTFDDTFTQGPPPVGGDFGSNLLAFDTNNGSIVPEANGKAILTATGSTPNATLASTDSTGAILLTNTQPEGTGSGQSELGLKEDQTFTMSGTYDFALPGIAAYGIELVNGSSSSTNTEVVQLTVESGVNPQGAEVALYETNLVTGVHTQLIHQVLTAAQIASTTQIELDLAHNTAGSQAITGSFELLDNGTQTFADTFATTGTEFDSSTFVRAAAFASSPPSVGITGTAQEGQTLTAVAVTNDSDATINYQWQESNNGTNWNNIGTNSSTYVVQESDEGYNIRVVATTSDPDNSQSASATSAATASVIDDASISLSVSVVNSLPVQQGQTLVATATASGDADDASAPITYQWQSSSDGGVTWTNVAASASGGFGSAGAASSFYQMTEADEGKLFRAQASFTDDTGQVVSTTSAPTVPVADVTPEMTAPFTYTISDLSITKTVNGTPTQIYNDTFGQAPLASPTILSNGVATDIAFLTLGSTWTTSANGAVMSSTNVAPNGAITGNTEVFAMLNTNTASTSTLGLKEGGTFSVSSTFGLTAHPVGSYGMELNDGTSTHGVDQLERLIVTQMNGNTVIELAQRDLASNPQTNNIIATYTLTSTELSTDNQVEFQFSHTANTQVVSGSFELLDNGVVDTSVSPSTGGVVSLGTSSIFTNDANGNPVDWTRVDVGAFVNDGPSLNIAVGSSPREGQTLTASAVTTNDSDSTFVGYQWQSSSDGGTTWNAIAGATSSSYTVRESDEGTELRVLAIGTDSETGQITAPSVATGVVLDALPTVTTPIITGTAQEGQTLTASAAAGQADNTVSYQWVEDNGPGGAYQNIAGATGSTYAVQEADEGFNIEVTATATNGNGAQVSATSAATLAVLDAAPTITTPTITGTAQEGQTLTASAAAGQPDNTVSYQWVEDNGPGGAYQNIAGATGSTYAVQEADEGFNIEVTATATNGNGAQVSATSAATLAVLDALPTVTTPTITGTAQEGQTLTASAAAGQPDNAVSYQWVENNGPGGAYQNIAGATGSTYVVQEADEGFNIEVVATATNGNGAQVSATSAATASVIDDASISLSVSVVNSLPVQQGQTLVATATASGDADDASAPITYQWQSSSDGGVTWTNVAASASGGFGSAGAASSFYQMTEADEGKLFRAQASFTDDTGQVVSTTSAPTVPVADVTPEMTAPFTYTISDLSITKTVNGTPTQIYNDTFGQAPLASPTILSNGVATDIAFLTLGSTWTTSANGAVMSSTNVAPNGAITGNTEVFAMLNTNTASTSTLGLKEGGTFSVSSTFGLTAHPVGSYGMELNDGTSTHGVDQLERLIVTQMNGNTVIELAQRDLASNPQTNNIIATYTLTSTELSTDNQVEFQFSHTANTQVVSGSFELLDNGVVDTSVSPSTGGVVSLGTSSIFTNDANGNPVDWTRVDVGAFVNDGPSLNIAVGSSPREGQTLTASAVTTNDSDSTFVGYQWQSSSDGGTTWNAIAGATSSSYTVRESDEGTELRVLAIGTDSETGQITAPSVATGVVLDALPTVTTPIITGTAQEGQTLTASAAAGQADNTVSYQWVEDNGPGGAYQNIAGATGSTYAVQEADEGFNIEVTATATNGNGAQVSATSAATLAVLDAAPTITTPTITGTAQEGQTLTASAAAGQPDNTVSYQWVEDNGPGGAYQNIAGATGSTYAVQEADEGFNIEVTATATNGNGAQVSATSAATLAVLDALPTVTTPTITGTAQEGQTLTASASSGQSDNPVSYAWYSSADGYTTAIGTGATYVVKEGDENATIEAKATATNANGVQVSAISAATGAVVETPEPPVLGGATSKTVNESSAVSLGATDTAVDSDDTLGNVTITGLPNDLTNVNGGTYTPGLVNFDSVNTSGGAISGTPVTNYLASDGITFTSASGTPTILPYLAGNPFPNPVSSPNWFGVSGPGSGFTYTFTFAAPENSVSFTVPGTGSTTTMAAWSATAFSANGTQLGQVGNSNITGPNSQTQTYTLTGPGIAYVQFFDNVENFAGNHLAIDNLTLNGATGTWTGSAAQFNALTFTAGNAGNYPLTILATTSGANAGPSATESYTLNVNLVAGVTTAFTQENDAVSGYLNVPAPSSLTYTILTGPSHDQLLQIASTGIYTYTPAANYTGSDSFTYQAKDSSGNVTTGTVNVTVAPSGTSTVPITSSGVFDNEYPGGDSISALSNGNFVATWVVNSATAEAEVFNQAGSPVGGTITVGTGNYTSAVTGLTGGIYAGGFAVASNGSLNIYNSAGTLRQILSTTGESYPSIDSAPDGSIYLQSVEGGSLQRYQIVGGSYVENATVSDPSNYYPEVKVLSDGDLVVLNDDGQNVFGLYHSTSGGLTRFASGTYSGSPYYNDVAPLTNGGFVITSTTSSGFLEASIFTSTGSPVTTVTTAVQPIGGDDFTHVSELEGGGFVVAAVNNAGTATSFQEFSNTGVALSSVASIPSGFFITTAATSSGFILMSQNDSTNNPISAYIDNSAPLSEVGDGGADAFVANSLSDTFTGGAGKNIFQFGSSFGQDTVTNFSPSKDVLLFNTAVFANYTTAIAHAANDGKGDTVITAATGESVTLTGVSLSSLSSSNFQFSGTSQPAGAAGSPINLALAAPSVDSVGEVAVSVSGLPTGWSLSGGVENAAGAWTVGTADPSSLTVTTPTNFVGADLISVTESWTDSSSALNTVTLADNVEAFATGSPIFAEAGADTLTGAGGGDEFVFAQPIANDVIDSFNAASDRIDLLGFNGFTSFSDVQAQIADDASGNAVIALGDGQTITLDGIDAGALTGSNFVFNQQPLTLNGAAIAIGDGATLPLGGTVDNTGSIALSSSGDQAYLQVLASGATLTGGGQINLSDSSGNMIAGATPSALLTNVDNTISGAGGIGDGSLALVNEGLIDATGTNALVIDTGANAIVNSGKLQTDGGTLNVKSAVIGGGSAVINGGAIEFAAASDANVSFGAGTAGTLQLDQSQSFTGTVTGFGGQNQLDLGDIAFGANATLGYAANSGNTGGTLTVSDGTNTANIALLGQYMAGSFATASDGHGGTMITDPPVQAQTQLTQPQHA